MPHLTRRTLLSAATAGAALAAAPAEIRLIVQGDDMGAAHAINLGTIEAYRNGIMRTTNMMLPTPWMPEAVRLLSENPGLDVGIHLTLTSEWSLVKWRPLTAVPSLVDAHGNFYPMVRPNPKFPAGQSLLEAQPTLADVERELRAQIELGKKLVSRVSYMSSHMGFASPFPAWQELLAKLSREYRLPIPGRDTGVASLGRLYDSTDPGPLRASKMAARLETLEPGTWMTIDHAALDTPEMRAIHHPGYEHVAADRAAVVAAWTSASVKEVIARRKIRLTGHQPEAV